VSTGHKQLQASVLTYAQGEGGQAGGSSKRGRTMYGIIKRKSTLLWSCVRELRWHCCTASCTARSRSHAVISCSNDRGSQILMSDSMPARRLAICLC
jgi:hypothetical protein